MTELPDVALLAEVADAGLHPLVHAWRSDDDRRRALCEELAWWLDVAAQDISYAREYAAHQPVAGGQPEQFLDRWRPVTSDLHVLSGPRYRARDPDMPFVGIVATDRLITADDIPALRSFGRREYSAFAPRYLCWWSAHPVGAWPATR